MVLHCRDKQKDVGLFRDQGHNNFISKEVITLVVDCLNVIRDKKKGQRCFRFLLHFMCTSSSMCMSFCY